MIVIAKFIQLAIYITIPSIAIYIIFSLINKYTKTTIFKNNQIRIIIAVLLSVPIGFWYFLQQQ
jgi:hypothetical protein